MNQRRIWAGLIAFAAVAAVATLVAACGGGAESEPEQTAAQAAGQTAQAEQAAAQAEQVESAEQDARVQVVRGRAALGDPAAPVLIQEYSDFL
ncbi:MAG: hypothetical protein OXI41_14640 [Chloroflexota bacterium]|nr:hypothetical protein [Chloroflexota bacterium]MDE2895809.1 hypothetical protein [Chloroflexota bacterium]